MYGNPDDPALVLLQTGGPGGPFWSELAGALAQAGRYVLHIESPFSEAPGGIRRYLESLDRRPALLAAGLSTAQLRDLLGPSDCELLSGLILIDPLTDGPERFRVPAGLVIEGLSGPLSASGDGDSAKFIPDAEYVRLDPGAGFPFEDLSGILVDFLERRLPRTRPEYRLGSDQRTLRDALGCFATGVTVLTTLTGDRQPVGLTANSFTSVSLDPPLLLVCIAKSATSAASFKTCAQFAVNVLHIGQQPVSSRFAKKGEERFSQTRWEPGLEGCPVLTGSLATFECTTHELLDGGDHIILIGAVERARFEPHRDPLLYFRGKYRRLHFS